VLTKEGIHTLIDVVIVDPTQTNLFSLSYTTQRVVACDATQAKERNYRNQHRIDQFFFLIIEIFGYYLTLKNNYNMCM
jgi:hypothetical protein